MGIIIFYCALVAITIILSTRLVVKHWRYIFIYVVPFVLLGVVLGEFMGYNLGKWQLSREERQRQEQHRAEELRLQAEWQQWTRTHPSPSTQSN